MEALYTDIEGNPLRSSEWDIHHVISRSVLHGRGEQDWGNQNGLRVPMVKRFHNLGKICLHTQVPHPPRPNKDIMQAVRFRLYIAGTDNPYDRFLTVVDTVNQIAETSTNDRTAWLADRLATNLAQQAQWILAGQVLIQPLQEAA